jgi:hypothetical protein
VTVEDGSRCLDREALDLEARGLLGDEVVDGIELRASVYDLDGLQLAIEVHDDGLLLWQRQVSIERQDCQYLPALIAGSVERGLASLQGWGLDRDARPRPRPELGLFATASVPASVRLGGGASLLVPVVHGFGLQLDLEAFGAPRQLIDAEDATTFSLFGARAALGPTVSRAIGWDELRAGVRAAVGPSLFVGHDLRNSRYDVHAHPFLVADAGWVWRHGIRLLARCELPLHPARVEGTYVEPFVRVGWTVGWGGRIGSTEGSRRERP